MNPTPSQVALDYASPHTPKAHWKWRWVVELVGFVVNLAASAAVMLGAVQIPQHVVWASYRAGMSIGCGMGRFKPEQRIYELSLLLPLAFIGGCVSASNLTYARIGRAAFVTAVMVWGLVYLYVHGHLKWLFQ